MKIHRRTAPVLLFLLSTFTTRAQGLEMMPEAEYKKLGSPPMLCGAPGAAPGSGLPEQHIIPEKFFPVPGNQGEQPSCTAWATGYALMSFYQAGKQGWTLDDNNHVFSPSYIYQSIKKSTNCSSGTYISDALNFMKTTGNVPITAFPYDAASCEAPHASLGSKAAQYRFTNWFRVEDVTNLNDIKSYLSQDIPVVIAAYTDKAFSEYSNKKDTDVFKWTSGNYKGGAHAMLTVGYDNQRGAFKVLNSWGTGWGCKGYVWIDYQSFRTMVMEAYVVEKNYTLPDGKPDADTAKPVTTTDVSADLFGVYGYSEEIREGRYHVTLGFEIDDAVKDRVTRVEYFYNHPSFSNKKAVSTAKPHFTTSYEGWGCLEDMEAVVHFNDGTTLALSFDACELIALSAEDEENGDDEGDDEETDITTVEITPVIIAEPTEEAGQYTFTVQLRGIDPILGDIEKVVYDRNHSSFSQRYVATYDRANRFEGGYTGWGCLNNLNVTIYFYDGTTESFDIDMCEALGW